MFLFASLHRSGGFSRFQNEFAQRNHGAARIPAQRARGQVVCRGQGHAAVLGRLRRPFRPEETRQGTYLLRRKLIIIKNNPFATVSCRYSSIIT